MAITNAQKQAAENRQWKAARDTSPQVRLVAGPGTGKSYTIEKRIADLLEKHATPENIYVISFTRATCAELSKRIESFCSKTPYAEDVKRIRVSTMHSLALRILRRGNLLTSYPSSPIMLDDWEQKHVYDRELAGTIGCNPGRASEIRLAYDARWQTLDPEQLDQAEITETEKEAFNAFHSERTNLYSCVLPGEVIYKCVEALNLGHLQEATLPCVDHLIVDKYQDLNACDQKFIRLLCSNGAVLFIAGDDDQSIYTFRHADPTGIVEFASDYPDSSTHILTDCFRCTPAVLEPASKVIAFNRRRIKKNLTPLYGAANPPVQGQVHVWSFRSDKDEARAIAQSCSNLIKAGMAGREDEILILIANRRVQLNTITQELEKLSIPYEQPRGGKMAIRLLISSLLLHRYWLH